MFEKEDTNDETNDLPDVEECGTEAEEDDEGGDGAEEHQQAGLQGDGGVRWRVRQPRPGQEKM